MALRSYPQGTPFTGVIGRTTDPRDELIADTEADLRLARMRQ